MGKKKSENNQEFVMEDFEIDEEKAQKLYEKSYSEAEEILQDEDKMERFLQKLERKLRTVPIAGSALAYVPIMMSLVKSYVKREYTELPIATMISVVVALIYFLSPIDIIPDVVPFAGYIDDAAIIVACLAFIRTDLEDYRIWRKENGYEIDDLPDYDDVAKDTEKYSKIAEVFFKRKNK